MLIRYPGSKDRHLDKILPALAPHIEDRRLCEPFAGTASVTFECIRRGLVDQVWINDLNPDMASLWSTVRDYPDHLCRLVGEYRPSPESFYELREADQPDPLTRAYATIVLHQISFSGLGRRAGSPIGGRNQTGKYPVGCRWNAERLCADIRETHGLLNKVHATVTNLDWSDCPSWTWYLDPPYVAAGPGLYREGVFSVRALRDHLWEKAEWWVLSYDAHPEVVAAFSEPYGFIDSGGETYLGNRRNWANRRTELLITPKQPRFDLIPSGG